MKSLEEQILDRLTIIANEEEFTATVLDLAEWTGAPIFEIETIVDALEIEGRILGECNANGDQLYWMAGEF